MERTVYKVLAKVLGVVLLLVGIGATYGGSWAHNYVKDQLSAQKIDMPAAAGLTNDTMKQHLSKYVGQKMETGPQAEAFANYYILEHMNASSQGKTYEEVSGEYIAMGKANPKLADGTATKEELAAYNKLGGLRQSLFMGDSLRGMLLNAYAWWTVGTIALWVGIGSIILGALLLLAGFLLFKNRAAHRVVVEEPATTV